MFIFSNFTILSIFSNVPYCLARLKVSILFPLKMPKKWRFWGSLLQYHVPYIHIARDSHLPFFLPFQADKHQKIRYRNAFAQISTYIHSFMLEDGIFTYIFFQALLRVCCVINAQPRTLPKNKIAWTNCWIHYHVTLLMVIALYYRNTWWQVSIILGLRRPRRPQRPTSTQMIRGYMHAKFQPL